MNEYLLLSFWTWTAWVLFGRPIFWEPLRQARLHNALTVLRFQALAYAVEANAADERIKIMDSQMQFMVKAMSSITITKILLMYSNARAPDSAEDRQRAMSTMQPETFMLIMRSIPYVLLSIGLGTFGGLLCFGLCLAVAGPTRTKAIVANLTPMLATLIQNVAEQPLPA
jgi:hypothetical protein